LPYKEIYKRQGENKGAGAKEKRHGFQKAEKK